MQPILTQDPTNRCVGDTVQCECVRYTSRHLAQVDPVLLELWQKLQEPLSWQLKLKLERAHLDIVRRSSRRKRDLRSAPLDATMWHVAANPNERNGWF